MILESSKTLALSKFKAFISLCEDIGAPLANDKTELPSQVMNFVGITLDIPKQEARIPEVKLVKYKDLLEKFLERKRCTLNEMQSLIGVLNFACSVVLSGRAFLRRMINLTMHISNAQTHLFLTTEAKEDMQMWLSFCLILMVNVFS